jgi:hypothetical protein
VQPAESLCSIGFRRIVAKMIAKIKFQKRFGGNENLIHLCNPNANDANGTKAREFLKYRKDVGH